MEGGARRIFLLGFMGAGKTTVGRTLARNLDMDFVDLDREIEAAAGASVARLFAERGEEAFREFEAQALERAAAGPPAVIAAGGGVVTRPANLRRMKESGTTVWLRPSFDTVLARMTPDEIAARPLFDHPAAARELYERRLPAYRRADLAVDIDSAATPAEVSRKILARLGEGPCAT